MVIVSNASPLIHVAKAGYSRIFEKFEIVVPPAVYDEVVTKGKEKGAADAFILEKLFRDKSLRVVEIRDEKNLEFISELSAGASKPLHAGEAEVLALAKELDELALIDERVGRQLSKALGVDVRTTIYLFVKLFEAGELAKDEVLEALEALVKTSWWLSPKDYELVKSELEAL